MNEDERAYRLRQYYESEGLKKKSKDHHSLVWYKILEKYHSPFPIASFNTSNVSIYFKIVNLVNYKISQKLICKGTLKTYFQVYIRARLKFAPNVSKEALWKGHSLKKNIFRKSPYFSVMKYFGIILTRSVDGWRWAYHHSKPILHNLERCIVD